MDIKAKAEEILKKIQADKNFSSKFQKDPVKAVESVLGVDLPDDQINKLIELVKAKLTADTIGDIAGKLGGLFK